MSLLASLILTQTVFAESSFDKQEHKLIPAFKYFDCAPKVFPQGNVNLIEGSHLQNVGKKKSTSFVQGAQFFVVTNANNEFVGLLAVFNNSKDPDIFLDKKYLEDIVYIESNELQPGSAFKDYHLPVFSFELCKDLPPAQGFACLDLGYLKDVNPMMDILIPMMKNKLVHLMDDGESSNVLNNHDRILADKPSRWTYQRLYIDWSINQKANVYFKSSSLGLVPLNTILGKLKIDDNGGYWGIENIVFEYLDLNLSPSNKTQQIDNWLKTNNCQIF